MAETVQRCRLILNQRDNRVVDDQNVIKTFVKHPIKPSKISSKLLLIFIHFEII